MTEEDRYSRQQLIPGWDQAKLDNSTAIIVGVGAIGSYVGTILVSSGIGKLIIIEYDTVEISNLNRQLLFHEEDIGESKAEIAAKKLKVINPSIDINYLNMKMEDVPVSTYEEADVIIGCLDTFIGRRWINSMALRVGKPLILGGMFAFLGNVQVMIPDITPCFECQPLIPEEELAQACTPFGDERKKDRDELEEELPLPAVATLSSIIGGLMAQEALKILLNLGTNIDNYLFYDGLNNAITILTLAKNKECPACGEMYELEQIEFVVNPKETVKDLILRLALTYGLEKPDIMIQGQLLEIDKEIEETNLSQKAVAFVLDKNLAKPIKIVIQVQDS